MTVDADSGLNNRRGRGLEYSDGNATRGVNEVKIGGVEERNQARTAIRAEDATTLSAVLMTDRG